MTCRGHKCECKEYEHEKKIGEYDTCRCHHTRNTHKEET